MALPELTKKNVEKTLLAYCEARVPKHVRHKVRLDFSNKGNAVVMFEVRPVYNDPSQFTEGPVAQFKFIAVQKKWVLYWKDRNLKWHIYDGVSPTPNFDKLLAEVDKDPTGIFWG